MWESENQDESPLMTTDNFHGIDRLVHSKTIPCGRDEARDFRRFHHGAPAIAP
jgi:hypothetical protein